jgi:predicted RNA polymerase sigma factor
MYDAFSAAFEQWTKEGVPANPALARFGGPGSRPSTRCDDAPGLKRHSRLSREQPDQGRKDPTTSKSEFGPQ